MDQATLDGIAPWSHRRRERLDRLEFLLDAAPGASLLDLGCNRGLVGYEFARCGAATVHGIDINPRAIDTARHLFDDVAGTGSAFIRWDLANGLPPYGLAERYTIVCMFGVVHKLQRVMSATALAALIAAAADKTERHFAWNGFDEEFPIIDPVFAARGFKVTARHQSPLHNVAVWGK